MAGGRRTVIRPGATRLELYCGGVVFLYDEGNLAAIRGRMSPGDDRLFDIKLGDAAFARALSDGGLCVAIAMEGRDEDFTADLSVGDPLTPDELSVARWLRPQFARLHLPTGRLEFATPYTMPLDLDRPDAEEADDDDQLSARVEVPPGDNLLTVHRIDWEGMRRAGLRRAYRGPAQFLVLTPLDRAPAVPVEGAVLSCPDPEPDRTWIGNYAIAGREFACQLLFWDFRSWFRLNLDRAAIRQLGLRSGDVFRVQAGGLSIDAVFLDCEPSPDTTGYAPQQRHDETLASFRRRYGRERLAREIASRAEFAIGSWNRFMDQELLGFHREKSTQAVPLATQGVWLPAQGAVLGESFQS